MTKKLVGFLLAAIGLMASLIGIFVFVTGKQSINDVLSSSPENQIPEVATNLPTNSFTPTENVIIPPPTFIFVVPTLTLQFPENTTATLAFSALEVATRPTISFTHAINVRRGPGLEFDPPIGAFNAGQSTEILALNPAGTWYKVRYGGGEGWIFANLAPPMASNDLASLPRDSGPPVPTPPPSTAIPPTQPPQTPASNANLVAGIIELSPGQPTCNQTFNIGFDIANLGSEPTANSGTVSVQDVRSADGSVQQTTIGGYPVLQAQQTFRVNMPLTVSTLYNEVHVLILIIDPTNQIPEADEGDNRREVRYTLQKGSCI